MIECETQQICERIAQQQIDISIHIVETIIMVSVIVIFLLFMRDIYRDYRESKKAFDELEEKVDEWEEKNRDG